MSEVTEPGVVALELPMSLDFYEAYELADIQTRREALLKDLAVGAVRIVNRKRVKIDGSNVQDFWKEEVKSAATVAWAIGMKVPPIYRRTDPTRLPDRAAYDAALGHWRQGQSPSGLILTGGTGSGKTRAACQCVIEAQYGEQLAFITATELSRLIREGTWEDAKRTRRILSLLRGDGSDEESEDADADLARYWADGGIVIDDLHHARGTARYLEELLAMVEAHTSEERTVIVTCQTTATGLVETMCSRDESLRETAEAIVRRLQEFCVHVPFHA
jgi:hypothetical protein